MASTTLIPIDEELHRRAQQLAKARNMTVQEYVERLLRVVTAGPVRDEELGPITRSLRGVLPPQTDEDDRRVLEEELMKKHGIE